MSRVNLEIAVSDLVAVRAIENPLCSLSVAGKSHTFSVNSKSTVISDVHITPHDILLLIIFDANSEIGRV